MIAEQDMSLEQLRVALLEKQAFKDEQTFYRMLYGFASIASEALQVLIDNDVEDPFCVLYDMLRQRTIASLADQLSRAFTARPVSQQSQLYKVFLNYNLPVFGEEYLTGQLRRQDMYCLLNDLTKLYQPAARFMTACRNEEEVTMPYCLNKDGTLARALGFDFVLHGDGNLSESVSSFRWVG